MDLAGGSSLCAHTVPDFFVVLGGEALLSASSRIYETHAIKVAKKKNSCGVHCWQRNFLFHLLARGCIYVAVYATNAQRAKKKI